MGAVGLYLLKNMPSFHGNDRILQGICQNHAPGQIGLNFFFGHLPAIKANAFRWSGAAPASITWTSRKASQLIRELAPSLFFMQ